MGLDTPWFGTWAPGFNDPSVMGWFITMAYLWVALICRNLAAAPSASGPVGVRVVSGARQISRNAASGLAPLERRYYRALGWALFILGVNKQLDLQTPFFLLARAVADSFDLRSLKIVLLVGFAFVLAAFLLLLTGLLWVVARRLGPPARVAAGGCMALLLFVFVRALSFEMLAEDNLWRLILFDSGVLEAVALGWIAFGVRLRRKRVAVRGSSG